MANATPTAIEIFCPATVEQYGERKLNRLLERARELAEGRSFTQLRDAFYKAGREIWKNELELIKDLFDELQMATTRRVSAHGVSPKSHDLLESKIHEEG